tara:strand:- start:345 stop:683 length:339 start_codon:yes stop_codon:yes gene_type:complete
MQLTPTEQERENKERRASDRHAQKVAIEQHWNSRLVAWFTCAGIIIGGAMYLSKVSAREEVKPLEIDLAKQSTRIEAVETKQTETDSRAVRFESKMDTKLDNITTLIMSLKK